MRQKLIYGNGLQLSYAEYGDPAGYPILIQHGLIASIEEYALFDPLLQNQDRLICMARPGYGESSPHQMDSFAEWAEIVLFLVRKLNLARFDLLGMSSGAPYSYSIACRLPDQVRNVFIFSGVPALYDETVRSDWPYPATTGQDIASLQILAQQLFFSNLGEEDLKRADIRDSRMHDAFGVAQDLRLRFLEWGFRMSDVKARVFMRHSKQDGEIPFRTAVRTADLLPNCHLNMQETGPHFSIDTLHRFIMETMIPNL